MKSLSKNISMALVVAFSLSFSACSSSSSDTPSKQEQAIALIAEYAKSGTIPPTIEDYTDAGAIGVNAENLDEINAVVLGLTYEDVDTKEEILALADNLGITISDITPPTFTSNATASVNENQTSAITLVATDSVSAVTYSINSDDASSFSVNATTGVVTFNSAPDFESKNSYSFTAVATDSSENSSTQDVTINIVDVNEGGVVVPDTTPPTFTSNATASVNENQTSAITLVATDSESAVTYSINSDDASSFSVNATTGVVTFNAAPDFETQQNYSFTAVATDASANAVTQSVSIIVLDIVEAVVPISQNGVNYLEVTSPYTARVWLDRNLGASQACTALDDTACYGDYYQWGRNADGHQLSSSATNAAQATDINSVGHSDFITSTDTYDYDWAQAADSDGSLRAANWSKTDGSSVCPVGFRVPTEQELRDETLDNTGGDAFANNTDAYDNFLKLPSAGYRYGGDGSLHYQGSYGIVWSSSVTGSYSHGLIFFSGGADTGNDYRAHGFSVRCLKD